MDKAGFSGKPRKKTSDRSVDDIPEALRDTTTNARAASRKNQVFLIAGLLSLGALALTAGAWYFSAALQRNAISDSVSVKAPSPTPTQSTDETKSSPSDSQTLLGHFAYSEAPPEELQPIVADGHIQMRKAAAQKFKAMVAAARASGVMLVPISGYRSVKDQQYLFFNVKAQRSQVTTERAAVSAPPGYSEHHTGYAVDVGDGAVPATNLNQNFDKTRAYKWLSANAARFSFEMSFPKDNPQGVSYEPWHWRFVGDSKSLETFYKARGGSRE